MVLARQNQEFILFTDFFSDMLQDEQNAAVDVSSIYVSSFLSRFFVATLYYFLFDP